MIKKKDFGNNNPKNSLCCHCFGDKSMGAGEEKENIGTEIEKADLDIPRISFNGIDADKNKKM